MKVVREGIGGPDLGKCVCNYNYSSLLIRRRYQRFFNVEKCLKGEAALNLSFAKHNLLLIFLNLRNVIHDYKMPQKIFDFITFIIIEMTIIRIWYLVHIAITTSPNLGEKLKHKISGRSLLNILVFQTFRVKVFHVEISGCFLFNFSVRLYRFFDDRILNCRMFTNISRWVYNTISVKDTNVYRMSHNGTMYVVRWIQLGFSGHVHSYCLQILASQGLLVCGRKC